VAGTRFAGTPAIRARCPGSSSTAVPGVARAKVRRQHRAQLGRGVRGHAEDPAEHRVVRAVRAAQLLTAGFRPGRGRRPATGVRLICHAPHRTGPRRHSTAAQHTAPAKARTRSPAPAVNAPSGTLYDHLRSSDGSDTHRCRQPRYQIETFMCLCGPDGESCPHEPSRRAPMEIGVASASKWP
jgi:hypothetical protein